MAIILIVDDHHLNRELLVTLLNYSGHQMLEAADGEEGLALARAKRPHLIITDMVMPTMDGYEFARRVRADPVIGKTQIIFYTSSYVVAETRRLAEACGVAYVIPKPAEPHEILNTVNAALEAKSPPVIPPTSEEFHHKQMRLLTDTLARRVEELEREIAEHKKANELLAKLYVVIQDEAPARSSLDKYLEQVKSEMTQSSNELSPREQEVVSLIAAGRTNKEISQQLSVSVRTVERHRASITRKLKLHSRAELVSYAVRQSLLSGKISK